MKHNLFGTLGNLIKGNTVIIILAIATIAAGVLSFNTIKDINKRLDEQQLPQTDQVKEQPENADENTDETKDVQNNAENVPLKPKPSARPKATPAPDGNSETAEQTADQVPQTKDKFILPIDSAIVNGFSGDELVYSTTMSDWRTHNGIDIKATRDTGVKACCDGVVKKVYSDGMLGWVVEVGTDDFITRYCGLGSNVFVKEGQSVTQGQSLGAVGEIPLESGEDSHLHLEIIKNGKYQNPDEYLKQ